MSLVLLRKYSNLCSNLKNKYQSMTKRLFSDHPRNKLPKKYSKKTWNDQWVTTKKLRSRYKIPMKTNTLILKLLSQTIITLIKVFQMEAPSLKPKRKLGLFTWIIRLMASGNFWLFRIFWAARKGIWLGAWLDSKKPKKRLKMVQWLSAI